MKTHSRARLAGPVVATLAGMFLLVTLLGQWDRAAGSTAAAWDASPSEQTWSITYSPGHNDFVNGVSADIGGRMMIVGRSWAFGSDSAWAVMHEPSGEIVWQKHFGLGEWYDGLYTLARAANGDALIGGRLGRTAYLARLATDGTILWQESISGPFAIEHLIELEDGSLVAAGEMWVGPEPAWLVPNGGSPIYQMPIDRGNRSPLDEFATWVEDKMQEFCLIKLDAQGNLLWARHYGTSQSDTPRYLAATDDGGIIIGDSLSLLRLDAAGSILWQKESEIGEWIVDAVAASDGAVVAAVAIDEGFSLLQLDTEGNLMSQLGFDLGFTPFIKELYRLPDQGYLLVGEREFPSPDEPLIKSWAVRLDPAGSVIWAREYGASQKQDRLEVASVGPASELVLAGSTRPSGNEAEADVWVMRLDGDGDAERCPRIQTFDVLTTTQIPRLYNHDATSGVLHLNISAVDPSKNDLGVTPVGVCPVPHLTIGKTGPQAVMALEPITYTLAITNNAAFTLSEVLLTDTLPTGATYLGGGTLVGDQVQWQLAALPGEARVERQFAVQSSIQTVNEAYHVSCAEGYSNTGQIPVVTAVRSDVFVPMAVRNYCSPFIDAFDDPHSGWPIVASEDLDLAYVNGEYQMRVSDDGSVYLVASPACDRPDTLVEVEARWVGVTGASYGLLFGLQGDYERFYLFDINTDYQQYRLLRADESGVVNLAGPAGSDAINPGLATNHLRATRSGTAITLEINGVLLGTWDDSGIMGLAGAGIGTGSYAGMGAADARFDNFASREAPGTGTVAPLPAAPRSSRTSAVSKRASLIWPSP